MTIRELYEIIESRRNSDESTSYTKQLLDRGLDRITQKVGEESVDRDSVREGNNNLVKRCDEIWVFGAVSNGVLAEIQIAKERGKKVRYFAIEKPHKIIETDKNSVELEEDIKDLYHLI